MADRRLEETYLITMNFHFMERSEPDGSDEARLLMLSRVACVASPALVSGISAGAVGDEHQTPLSEPRYWTSVMGVASIWVVLRGEGMQSSNSGLASWRVWALASSEEVVPGVGVLITGKSVVSSNDELSRGVLVLNGGSSFVDKSPVSVTNSESNSASGLALGGSSF